MYCLVLMIDDFRLREICIQFRSDTNETGTCPPFVNESLFYMAE